MIIKKIFHRAGQFSFYQQPLIDVTQGSILVKQLNAPDDFIKALLGHPAFNLQRQTFVILPLVLFTNPRKTFE